MADIDYTTVCPSCKKKGIDSTLGFMMATGKFVCTGNPVHEFENLPGESDPVVTDIRPDEANNLEPDPAAEPLPEEPEKQAAEESRLAAILNEIKTQPDAKKVAGVKPKPPLVVTSAVSANAAAGTDEMLPMVSLGGMFKLRNGDLLCGVTLSETWLTSLQSHGEEQNPRKTVTEVLQEIIDQGMQDWYSSEPTPVAGTPKSEASMFNFR